jgi:GNAT superfamily N-acetyltransferase
MQTTKSIDVLPVRSSTDATAAAGLMRDLMAANIALYPSWRERILAANKGRWFLSDGVLPDENYRLPNGDIMLARIDDMSVATVAWTRLGTHRVELQSMFVAEVARRRGVAAALSLAVVDSARQVGFTEIVLYTGERQAEAQALYERLGWSRIEPYEPEPKPGRLYYSLSLGDS